MVANQSQSSGPEPDSETSPLTPQPSDSGESAGSLQGFAGVGPLLVLINGVIAAIGGAYVTTGSVPVTVIAGGAGVLLAVFMMIKR